jgi:hypothetical protein
MTEIDTDAVGDIGGRSLLMSSSQTIMTEIDTDAVSDIGSRSLLMQLTDTPA